MQRPKHPAVARCDAPPRSTTKGENLVRVLPGPAQTWVILSRRLYGFLTHFQDGRTIPCAGVINRCTHCAMGGQPRFEGWIGVQKPYGRAQAFLALTPNAVETCPALVHFQGKLRGLEIHVSRQGTHKHGKMLASLGEGHWEERLLLEAPNVPLFIAHLWMLPPDATCDLFAGEDEQAYEAQEAAERMGAKGPRPDLYPKLSQIGKKQLEALKGRVAQ